MFLSELSYSETKRQKMKVSWMMLQKQGALNI